MNISHNNSSKSTTALRYVLGLGLSAMLIGALHAETSTEASDTNATSLESAPATQASQPDTQAQSTPTEASTDANADPHAHHAMPEATSQAEQAEYDESAPTFTLEVGGGYLGSYFSTTQQYLIFPYTQNTDAIASGIDAYIQGNYYLGEQKTYGLSVGLGIEMLPVVRWNNPIVRPTRSGYRKSYTNTLLSEYLTIGGFYDMHLDYGDIVRLFANVGASFNMLFGSSYQGSVSVENVQINGISGDVKNYTFHSQFSVPITLPITIGARYKVDNHGIEIAIKYNPLSAFYTIPSFLHTHISRPVSMSLRYVYEFQ